MSAHEYLPSPEEQQWLLDELARLVSLQGVGPLLRSPVLLPTSASLPDKWSPDATGVGRLCRRLLLYAGLGELRAEVVLYTNPTESEGGPAVLGGHATGHRVEGAAAWFAGIEDGCCRFGVDTNQLSEPAAVVGVMCHEVAHAFRAHHQLVHSEREVEELLTDLTTTFLGFGLLTANSAYLHRTEGGMVGSLTIHKWRTSEAGYLLPQAMCFLLAAQAVVRRTSESELRKLRRALEVTQEAYFKAAYKALASNSARLAQQLGVPAPEQWPAAADLTALTRPFTDPVVGASADALPAPETLPEPPPVNEGLPVFKVRQKKPNPMPLLFFPGVTAIAALLSGSYVYGLAMAVVTTGIGLVHRSVQRRAPWLCSEPECQSIIPPGAARCPGCGGGVAGTLRDANDRLTARAELLSRSAAPEPDDSEWEEPAAG